MRQRVFISYSHKDERFARDLVNDLNKNGTATWFDRDDIRPGTRWDEEIEKGIDGSTHFIYVMSPHSVSSRVARDELTVALQKNKKLLPILRATCEIPVTLTRIQYIDFQRNYRQQFQVLLQALRQDAIASQIESPSTPLPPALVEDTAHLTPTELAQVVDSQNQALATQQQLTQKIFIELNRHAKPCGTWNNTIDDEPTVGRAFASLAENSNDPQIRWLAALSIARLRSFSAVIPLTQQPDTEGKREALTRIRDKVALPESIPREIRHEIFWRTTWRQLFEQPLDLIARYSGASLGFGIGLGTAVYLTFVGSGIPFNIPLRNALALGAQYGLMVGVPITIALELASRLRTLNQWSRALLAAVIGTMLTTIGFAAFLWMSEDRPTLPAGLPVWSFLFIAGFAITPVFNNKSLTALAGIAGVFAATYFSATLNPNEVLRPTQSLIYFGKQPFMLSIIVALSTGLLVFLPEGYTYLREWLRRTVRSNTTRAHR